MAKGRGSGIVWAILSIVLLCIPAGIYLYVSGWVSGVEFSPDDFSRRSFHYNEMPFFGVSVRGISYDDSTPVFEQTLLNDGLIVDPNRPVKRWHLVSDSWSDIDSPDFDARLLCQFLDLRNELSESVWIKWNEDHPEFAKEFWPVIATLARENLYLDVSELMLKAEGLGKSDVDEFRQFMLDWSIAALNKKANSLLTDGESVSAVEVYTRSIEIEPRREALLARSQCYFEIGETEKGDQDTAAIEKLND